METNESSEDYLERILMLEETKGINKVHAVDIALSMGFSKPSVSIALKKLRIGNLLEVSDREDLILTPEGRIIAEKIYEKHRVISGLLKMIGVEKETASKDACRIEHVLSDDTYDRLKTLFYKERKKSKQ